MCISVGIAMLLYVTNRDAAKRASPIIAPEEKCVILQPGRG
jgi:hypothetical protein